jgi:hypothetical protein
VTDVCGKEAKLNTELALEVDGLVKIRVVDEEGDSETLRATPVDDNLRN